MRLYLSWIVLLAALNARGQQLDLGFEGHGTLRFTPGESIRLPEHWTLNEIGVQATGQPNDEFVLQIDGRFLGRGNVRSGLKLTRDNAGFLTGEVHTLRVMKGLDAIAEWTLERAQQAYIDTQRSVGGGEVPQVDILKPDLRFFGPNDAELAASITTEGEFTVKVAGKAVPRDPTLAGWGFTAAIERGADTRVIEVLVEDRQGSVHRYLLPIER